VAAVSSPRFGCLPLILSVAALFILRDEVGRVRDGESRRFVRTIRFTDFLFITVSGLSAAHTIYLAGGNVVVLDKQGKCDLNTAIFGPILASQRL
jgi:uncharacterized protein YigE (DUF2233 family)